MKFFSLIAAFLILAATLLAAQSNPIPLIYQPLSPASVSPGHAAFLLTVHGTGFLPGAVVSWNRKPLKTEFISSSVVRAAVPAKAVAAPSTGSVTVANPGGIASNLIYLPVRQPSSSISIQVDTAAISSGEVAVGDFNNDGKPDISFGNDLSNVGVFLNAGSGNFNLVSGPVSNSWVLNGNVVADFNNDGNLDLAVASTVGSPASWSGIYLGDGKGGLSAPNFSYPGIGAVADLNRDGYLDAVSVVSDGFITSLSCVLGNGDGSFTRKFIVRMRNVNSAGPPVFGDFNGDGYLDVAVTGPDPVAIYLGKGDGTLHQTASYRVPVQSDGVSYATVADMNGDGNLDIIASSGSLLLGRGDGTFALGPPLPIASGPNTSVGPISVADVNGDGKLDLVTAVRIDSAGDLQLNIMLGNGTGTFQSPITFAAGQAGGTYTLSEVAIADYNNDGLLDFAVSGGGETGNSIVLLQSPSN